MSRTRKDKGSNRKAAEHREKQREYERHWTKWRSKAALEDAFGKSR